MTGAEIVAMFEGMVDDSIDSTLAYQLLNNAKNKVEGEREWEMLKKLDTSASAASSPITLPSDWNRTISIFVGTTEFFQIPFEQQKQFSGSGRHWYLDLKNSRYYFTGSPSGTVNHFYIYQTDDVTAGTAPVWPARFHPLLALEMAELFFSIDQGERNFTWDDKFLVQKTLLKNAMVDWDVKLGKRAIENAAFQLTTGDDSIESVIANL